MTSVIFNYKGKDTIIQCNINDKIKDIYKKYETKIGEDISKLYFIYNGNKINDNLNLNEIINEEDKKRIIINILVNESNNINIKGKKIKLDEIICPKCTENIFLRKNEYKMNLYNCKNGPYSKLPIHFLPICQLLAKKKNWQSFNEFLLKMRSKFFLPIFFCQ